MKGFPETTTKSKPSHSKIFISWSGKLSHEIAILLDEHLSEIFPDADFFVSTEIEKGLPWFTEIIK